MKPTLDDRMKSLAAGSAPSMIPAAVAPPPAKEEVPDMTQLIKDAKERLGIARMIARHAELGESISLMDKERKALTDAIKPLMGRLQLGKAQWGDYRLSYSNSPRTTLDRDELLNHGVQPAIIAACTHTKDSYQLRITRGKDADGE